MRKKLIGETDNQKPGIKALGRKELLRHLKGEKLTQKESIFGKCYECCGGYLDGKYSCEMTECPLFPGMPYKDRKPENGL